jgi:hypothetical protein
MALAKVAATSTLTPKKPCSKPPTVLVQAETPGASSSESRLTNFPRDYIPPRKDTTKPVNLSKQTKYELVELEIPQGVIVEEVMLGLIPHLKYADHDITDENKFSDLASSKYLKRYVSVETSMVVIEREIWATRL